MAVYTHLTNDKIATHLTAHYALGEFISAHGIAEGVENTNYLVTTRLKGRETRWILTLFERRVNPEHLPFFVSLMAHLSEQQIPCPQPVALRDGSYLTPFTGKQSVIVTFLEGKSTTAPFAEQIHALGQMTARLHQATEHFPDSRPNALSLDGWDELFARIAPRVDTLQPGLSESLASELRYLRAHWPSDLPHGVVHADLFPDNVFFNGETVSGVIDFYFACADYFAYDLAITFNAWCFDAAHQFDAQKARAFFSGYHSIRPLTAPEIAAFPILCRGAALRFFLTRAHDLLFPQEGALVTAKDPMEYFAKLTFHQNISDAKAYGL